MKSICLMFRKSNNTENEIKTLFNSIAHFPFTLVKLSSLLLSCLFCLQIEERNLHKNISTINLKFLYFQKPNIPKAFLIYHSSTCVIMFMASTQKKILLYSSLSLSRTSYIIIYIVHISKYIGVENLKSLLPRIRLLFMDDFHVLPAFEVTCSSQWLVLMCKQVWIQIYYATIAVGLSWYISHTWLFFPLILNEYQST